MKPFNLKWILVGLLPFLIGCATMHSEIFIPAKPDLVWSVLIDETSYKDWNKVLVPVEGHTYKEGATIKYYFIDKDGSQTVIETEVVEMIKEKKLNQVGGFPVFLTQDHTWLLESVNEGTQLIQHEEFCGIYLLFWDTDWMEPAYQESMEKLREIIVDMKENEHNN